MNNFNLTEWALGHRAVVLFLIIVVSIAGVFSFSKLGQLEDPKFSVPSMTATVIWPGASAQQIQDQLLNRMMEAVHRYEGTVSNLMGDGIMPVLDKVVGQRGSEAPPQIWMSCPVIAAAAGDSR